MAHGAALLRARLSSGYLIESRVLSFYEAFALLMELAVELFSLANTQALIPPSLTFAIPT